MKPYGEDANATLRAIKDAVMYFLDGDDEKFHSGMVSAVCDGAAVNLGVWKGR